MINRCIKFEMSTITWNEAMKGKAKICKKILVFSHCFGNLRQVRGNAQSLSMARWKAHCRLSISDN